METAGQGIQEGAVDLGVQYPSSSEPVAVQQPQGSEPGAALQTGYSAVRYPRAARPEQSKLSGEATMEWKRQW